ncbi:MAG TPA: zf-HC2 domain-containing protein [Bryobacteraceae bacterium]|jgi:anti-sigma factor RsiW
MSKPQHTPKKPVDAADHPDEHRLLLLLDSELNPRELTQIKSHLRQCRKCRAIVRRLQQGMNAFGEYRQAVFLPGAGAPPRCWSAFPDLLDRTLAANERPGRTKAS